MSRSTNLVLALGTAALGLCALAGALSMLGWIHAPSHQRTRSSRSRADVVAIATALDDYAMQNDMRYPDSLADLVKPDPHGYAYLIGTSVPEDPWGREYGYVPPAATERPCVFTLGRDGLPGGEDDDADLDSESLLASPSTPK